MGAKMRVLCVDDDPDAVESAGELLSMAGCEVLGGLDEGERGDDGLLHGHGSIAHRSIAPSDARSAAR